MEESSKHVLKWHFQETLPRRSSGRRTLKVAAWAVLIPLPERNPCSCETTKNEGWHCSGTLHSRRPIQNEIGAQHFR